jgi:hypothetical protein
VTIIYCLLTQGKMRAALRDKVIELRRMMEVEV